MNISTFNTTILKRLRNARTYVAGLSRTKLVFAAVGLVFIATALTFMIAPSLKGGSATDAADAQAYKDSLQSQVENAGGEPAVGRDPSAQAQTSLADASSTPTGYGTRTSKPAAGVSGTTRHPASHSDVYGDPSKTGITSGGCYVDYGIPGEQCVPAGLANADGSLSCDKVRTKFPDGVKVSGKDRFHLDHNSDGWACGTGE